MQEIAELESGRSAPEENIRGIEVEKSRHVPTPRVVLSFVFGPIPSRKRNRRPVDVIHIVVNPYEEVGNHLVPGTRRENIGNSTVAQLVPKAIVDRVRGERFLLFVQQMYTCFFRGLDRRGLPLLL